ncbi:MAG TPA: DNA translocase FtsK [Actinomycetota bacterium]|nr:DNA translocase FtsK [Actinomycetota bacterium]
MASKTATRKPRSSPSKARGKKKAAIGPGARMDALGLGLMFVAVLSGLGLYGDWAGPAGRGIVWLLTVAVGSVALAIPPLLAWVSFLVLRRGETDEPARVVIGSSLTMWGAAGLQHLIATPGSSVLELEELPNVGGVLGAGLAWPLERLLSVWGAGVFVVAFIFLGLLITTKTPMARVVGWMQIALSLVLRLLSGLGVLLASGARAGVAFLRGAISNSPSTDEPPPKPERKPRLKKTPEEPVDDVSEPATVSMGASRTVLPARAGAPGGYRTPPLDLLATAGAGEISKKEIEETMTRLEAVLREFLVDASVTGFTAGPTVTRYEVELGPAVKVNSVVGLQNEIKYALASGELRILAPIPGRSAIGVEVPNRDRLAVTLGDVLRSKAAKAALHPLSVGLGKDISGAPVIVNLAEMPHLLIAGATGAGKSSCINAMLSSILARTRPDEVRLMLIDPKLVELSNYNGVPHLLTPVVTSPRKAAEALGWLVREMDARYEVLSTVGVRNSDTYNDAVRAGDLPAFADGMPRSPFPYYLVVIDELADLMMVASREVEDSICRLAQKARAVGIHLIVATQRPSVDVVTGVIKANIPSRMAFATASAQDSRVILDEGGADRLIGKGDLLYKHASAPRPQRIQGAWVSESEIASLIEWCSNQRDVSYVQGVFAEASSSGSQEHGDMTDEDLIRRATEMVVLSQLGSTSMLQRKLSIGFARAGRIMDILEQRGIVGPSLGSKPREVLMGPEELEAMMAPAGVGDDQA